MTPTPDVNALIERLEALDAAATDGPWSFDDAGDIFSGPHLIAIPCGENYAQWRDAPDGGAAEFSANARLIAEARNALPVLLAHLRTLQARVDDLEHSDAALHVYARDYFTFFDKADKNRSDIRMLYALKESEHNLRDLLDRREARTLISQEAQRHGE